ncbi:hypothetical protein [Nonomuraea sp. bgisy101]|uniref:hypothetical protein n=1 Tax=Nonomuraea sp. bgisy101 TaxID=3413784 RepID=UPI003D7101BD
MDANDFLMGNGIPSAHAYFKNAPFGTTVGGQITMQPEVTQQSDLDTGELKFWSDGKPMQQLVVTVQTNHRDSEVIDDDGQRRFYIKAKMLDAVRDAVRRSGAKGLEVGGTLMITYTADGEAKKRAHNPPKIYSATYAPPSAAAVNEMLTGAPAPAQPSGGFVPASQGPAPQWATPAAQPVAPQPQPAAPAPAMPAAGGAVDPAALAAAVAQMSDEQKRQLGLPV